MGDLRAGEKTYQLLHQVAGRAGREQKSGHVLIQTLPSSAPFIYCFTESSKGGLLSLRNARSKIS